MRAKTRTSLSKQHMELVTNTGKKTQTLYKSRKQTHNRKGWKRKWWNVSGRKALLLLWHPLCRCLLELNADMQWLAKVWQEEPCCLSPAPPAGEACACTPGRRAEELEETDEEGERGEIKLEQMGQQAIAIFSISLWICKTDRSSRINDSPPCGISEESFHSAGVDFFLLHV